jgi:hypothetical protein
MKTAILLAGLFCGLCSLPADLAAAAEDEIRYLLHYGQKVMITGTSADEHKWDRACRIKRKTNYIAIVQNDTSNYRIIPAPKGQIIETICPPDIFADAIRWYESLQKSSY